MRRTAVTRRSERNRCTRSRTATVIPGDAVPSMRIGTNPRWSKAELYSPRMPVFIIQFANTWQKLSASSERRGDEERDGERSLHRGYQGVEVELYGPPPIADCRSTIIKTRVSRRTDRRRDAAPRAARRNATERVRC